MEAISMEKNQSALLTNQSKEISNHDARKKGKVVQRNYIMNDLGALRKKLNHEGRKQDFRIAKEAKDGSNTIIQMRASFFDFIKAKFIDELSQNVEIDDIQNAEAAKAATESSGEAYVEYSMEITFRAKDMTHIVKLIAYTTTCQLMIQPIGEKSGIGVRARD